MVFPVVMYECESWIIKKAEHRITDAFELWYWRRLLRVPWTARRTNHPQGNQSWIVIGRTDAEAETPILWPPDAKNRLIWKDPDAGKDWRQEKRWVTEGKMVGWYHPLDGHEFEQAPGVGDGQGSLACCSPWGCKELDMTEQLNWLKEHCRSYQRVFMYNPLEWFLHLLRKKANHYFFSALHISRKLALRDVKTNHPLS